MKTTTILGILFLLLAILLFYLSYKGYLKDTVLERFDKISSLVAMLIGIVSLVLSFSNSSERSTLSTPPNINNSNIDKIESSIFNSPNAIINKGDPTNTAKDRFEKSQFIIKNEIINNFINISQIISFISEDKPTPFWDKRRPNETELNYQDRAKIELNNYIELLNRNLNLIQFSQLAYNSNRTNLSYSPVNDQYIEKVYYWQNESLDSLRRLISTMQHLTTLNSLSDTERTIKATYEHEEKLLTAKIALATSLSFFSQIADEQDASLLNTNFSLFSKEYSYKFSNGILGYQQAMQLAGNIVKDKIALTSKQLKHAKKREIDRRITDPYLLALRKRTGLPPTLTEAELFSLENKQINTQETDPVKLVEMAGFAYLESDGSTSQIYLEKAMSHPQISEDQKILLQAAIERLKNPSIYEGSLGILVVAVENGGAFSNANIRKGDIIIKLNDTPINDPFEIASSLATSSDIFLLATILREHKKHILKIKTGKSARATITTLVIFNRAQI